MEMNCAVLFSEPAFGTAMIILVSLRTREDEDNGACKRKKRRIFFGGKTKAYGCLKRRAAAARGRRLRRFRRSRRLLKEHSEEIRLGVLHQRLLFGHKKVRILAVVSERGHTAWFYLLEEAGNGVRDLAGVVLN